MFAFARNAVRSLRSSFKPDSSSIIDVLKRIIPKAVAFSRSSNCEHNIGHAMIPSCPDLPYEAITTFMAEKPTENVNCYTSGIVNIGTSDTYILFRYKYLVRPPVVS